MSACSGFGSWCCSRLDAWLVLLVRCCLRRRTAGVVGCWLSVVFAWPGLALCWCAPPPPVGVCRACAWPPSLVGRAVLVRGPLLAKACCVGGRLPRWWCLVWVVVICWVGCGCGCAVGFAGVGAVLVCGPPSWWGVLCWRVAPLLLGRAVLVAACRGGGVWFGLSSSVGWVVVAVVLLAWPVLMLCLFVPPPLGGACCVGACPLSC